MPVLSAQVVIGMEKYPDAGILFNYDDDYYSQGSAQIKEVFRALTKADILQAYISADIFGTSNVRADEVGYNLYVFDRRYQRNFTAS